MTLRAIDPSPLRERYAGPASKVGERPELQWLKIAKLRIDPRYQREIGQRGAKNVLHIASSFQWAKFTPVVVAPLGDGLLAIVDGQHRTTAASLRGFESVPCVIITADDAEQADAFVAINANVTAMSSLQLHAARLAAGDTSALELTELCREAGVTICRYPVPANNIKPGETLAVSMLQGTLKKFCRDVLIAALCSITQTRRGNPGLIRAQIVEALCTVLQAAPDWATSRKSLIFAMQTFDFAAEFNAARSKALEAGEKVSHLLTKRIGAHLAAGSLDRAEECSAPPAQVRQPSAANGVAGADKVIAHNGVSIELASGKHTVAFRGQRIEISPRGARLVAALAKAMPNCIGDDFLIGKLWNPRPSTASAMLDMVVADLAALKKLGLEVRTQRGIGRQLVERKS